MSVITKDLGIVTAYAYAVSKGYEGTEEQFAEDLANGANYAHEAAESAAAAAASAALAGTSAGEAASSATSASGSAATATTKAGEANASATAAAGSASTASTKAGEAATSATAAATAETAAETAQGKAEDAQNAAEDAQEAAETAQGKAEDAQEAAEEAQSAAESAQAAAESAAAEAAAQVDVVEAAGAAQVALVNAAGSTQITAVEEKGEEVLESIPPDYTEMTADVTNLKKTTIINIEDTTPSPVKTLTDGADGLPMALTVGIEPVQYLRGFDKPYPAGGSNNLIPDGTDTNNGYVDGYYLTSDGGMAENTIWYVSEYFPVSANTVYSFSSNAQLNLPSVCFYDSSKTFISGVNFNSQKTVQVTTPANAVYARAEQCKDIYTCIVQFELGSATTIKPYSNICPISGHTGINVFQTRKNLIQNITNFSSGAYIIRYKGYSANMLYGYPRMTGYWKAGTYKISFKTADTSFETGKVTFWVTKDGAVYNVDSDGNFKLPTSAGSNIFTRTAITGGYLVSATLKLKTDIQGIALGYYKYSYDGLPYTELQIEQGDSVTAYEAPSNTEYEITIPSTPGTVYGGSLTVNKDGTGQLVVDCVKHDLPTTGWDKLVSGSNIYNRARNNVWDEKPKSFSSGAKQLCNCLIPTNSISSAAHTPWTVAIYNTANNYLRVCFPDNDENYDTKEKAMAWITANAPYVVYEVETPIEYTLTASQVNALITSLHGVNNIFADSGDVLSVDYSADTKLYVDEHNEAEDTAITSIKGMIADSDAPVATASHAIGDVFICNDQLLRATSAIATGATIAVGTNVEVINLAEYIAEVVSSVSNVQTNLLGRMQDNTEKFMLLNSSNCGEDQTINTYSNQTKVTRHLNHVSFRKLGTSTTYYYVLLYGGDMQVISKSNWDTNGLKGFSNVTPIQIPYRATNDTLTDWAIDVVGENLTPSVQNGTSVGIATYDSVNDTYTYAWMATLTQGENKRAESVNLVKLLPEIATNRNFIIYARVRTGESQGDCWFNLHAIPHDATT